MKDHWVEPWARATSGWRWTRSWACSGGIHAHHHRFLAAMVVGPTSDETGWIWRVIEPAHDNGPPRTIAESVARVPLERAKAEADAVLASRGWLEVPIATQEEVDALLALAERLP